MEYPPISDDLKFLLEQKEFVHLATCTPAGYPHVMPKFVVKVENSKVYLADFVIQNTYQNILNNPYVSFSTTHLDSLNRYQVNGIAEILREGEEYNSLVKEFQKRTLRFSADRIIRGIRMGQKHHFFEVSFPDDLVILKIQIKEIVSVAPDAHIHKENFGKAALNQN